MVVDTWSTSLARYCLQNCFVMAIHLTHRLVSVIDRFVFWTLRVEVTVQKGEENGLVEGVLALGVVEDERKKLLGGVTGVV